MRGALLTEMERRLREEFAASMVEIEDQSHLHHGHAGAREGKGHFSLTIVAPDFLGKSRLERHRMIYAALGTLMHTDIHALQIDAQSPEDTG